MDTFEVPDCISAVRVFRYIDEARYAGFMGRGCNRQGTTVSTIGAATLHARFPGRNGTEGEKLWMIRKKT